MAGYVFPASRSQTWQMSRFRPNSSLEKKNLFFEFLLFVRLSVPFMKAFLSTLFSNPVLFYVNKDIQRAQ